jgi:DNA-binding beta-propeller fold protein YncE
VSPPALLGARENLNDQQTGTVTPVNLATRAVGTPIKAGEWPRAIAITPDGRTAYITTDYGNDSGTVTPINLATGLPGRPIDPVKDDAPMGIAISPDGAAIYVTSYLPSDSTVPTQTLGSMTAIGAASGRPAMRISAGYNPEALAITPDGTTAYVVNDYGFDGPSTVTPIQIATGTREKPISVGSGPVAIALTPRANQGGKR